MEWRNLYRGFIMGISDLIPGVSGGTIAVILGIYDRLLEAISGFFSRGWKQHIGFLIPLVAGMGAAILGLSKVMDYLLQNHYQPTQFFFLGLVIGVLPQLFRQADIKHKFSSLHYIALVISAILVASMAFFRPEGSAGLITDFTLTNISGLFFAGWLASMAMLLPGISGSFILLLLGVYPTAIHALSEMNLPLIIIIGAGVIIGFIVSSKVIRVLLQRYHYITFAIIIGLVLGSSIIVFPGFPTSVGAVLLCLATFVAGLVTVLLLNKTNR